MKKSIRNRGKINLQQYFQIFKQEEKVYLVPEPAVQKGMFHPRFQGRSGIIKGKQGECYKVALKDGKIEKTIIVHPIHLKKV